MAAIIKVISTIIGTYIGAGFASGKEIYLFFYIYGIWGIFGICISSIFIGYIIYNVIIISKNNNIDNYKKFINYIIKNKYIKLILNNIIDFFLILSFGVMISGFCTFLKQEFYIEKIISYLFIIFLCIIIFNKNINGILKINNILIPIIIFFIIFFTIRILPNSSCTIIKIKNINFNNNFIVNSILYANYNLLTIIPIVINIKKIINKKIYIKYVGIISGIIIFSLSVSIFIILMESDFLLNNIEMPVIFIVRNYGIIYKLIYCLIIGIAIITTAISTGYGYLQKYENNKKIYNKKILFLIIITIISVPIGFSKLISILYPVFGIIGLIQSYYIIKMKNNV